MKRIGLVLIALLIVMVPSVFAEKTCADDNIVCEHGSFEQEADISSGGAGSPPVIEYLWILPDENVYDAGTQLYPTLSSERNDIYMCIVVSDEQGREDVAQVFADVYHPDGTQDALPCVPSANNKCDYNGSAFDRNPQNGLFKYQLHANKGNLSDPVHIQFIENCVSDAVDAGLITQADAGLIFYNVFDQPAWNVYAVHAPMLYHQPAGMYEVKAWATDLSSDVSNKLSTFFEWVSTVALEVDFTDGLHYGTLQPTVYKVIQGNYLMSEGDGAPTVKNEGNERIKLSVKSSELAGATFDKKINDFDVKWDPMEISNGHGHVFFGNDEVVELVDPLELCQTEKIDFSVHADVGLPADTYSGILELWTSVYD